MYTAYVNGLGTYNYDSPRNMLHDKRSVVYLVIREKEPLQKLRLPSQGVSRIEGVVAMAKKVPQCAQLSNQITELRWVYFS